MTFGDPNVILPLAPSYNQRGNAGYSATVTNALDQRKVNMIYKPVTNALTGQTTLYTAKRPGVTLDTDNASLGTSGQVAYLVSFGANLGGSASSQMWVYSTSGNDVRASSTTTTTVVATAASNYPIYVDDTSIGGNDTVVLQIGTGPSAQTVWYSTAIGTWTQITDADFPDIIGKMEFQNGYAFALNDSNNVQRIYNSDINSLANWTATNYYTKEIQQDRTQGLARLGELLLAFGQETVEVLHVVGSPVGSPLATIRSRAARVGLHVSTGHYYCTIGQRMFFVSRHGNAARLSISMFDGARFEKVSKPNIDAILAENQYYSVNTVQFGGREAVGVALTTTSATTQRWLMFFPDQNEWFEWNSTVFCPIGAGGWQLGVGSNQHKLYTISSGADNWADAGTNYDAIMQFQIPAKGNARAFMPWCAIKGDTARSALNISTSFSDDDGQNWSTARNIDMTSTDKKLVRCGSWKGRRQVRFTNSANLEGRLEAFIARID